MIAFYFDQFTCFILPMFALGLFTCPSCDHLHMKISVGWLWWWVEISFTFPRPNNHIEQPA